jgi:hypothetical protein
VSNIDWLPKVSSDVSAQLEKNREDNWPEISAQLKVFCHAWVSTFSIDKARKEANLSRARAAEALRNPILAGYIDDLVGVNRADSILRREWVELEWIEFYDKVNGKVPVPHVTRDGDMVMAEDFNANATLGALKEISKISKAYPDGQGGGGGGVHVHIDFAALGADQAQEVTIDADFERLDD